MVAIVPHMRLHLRLSAPLGALVSASLLAVLATGCGGRALPPPELPDSGVDAGGQPDSGGPTDGGPLGDGGGPGDGGDQNPDAGPSDGGCGAACVPFTGPSPTPVQAKSNCGSGYCLPTSDDGGVCVVVDLPVTGGGTLAPYRALCDSCGGKCDFTCGGLQGLSCPAKCIPVTTAPPGCSDCQTTCRLP